MADLVKTITNSVRVFGGEHATEWGSSNFPYSMVWGSTLWGEGSYTTIFNLFHIISENISLSEAYAKSVGFQRTIIGEVTPSSTFTIQNLSDGSGWKYVFTSDTTNATYRDFVSYSTDSSNDATFVCASVGSTSWTEV